MGSRDIFARSRINRHLLVAGLVALGVLLPGTASKGQAQGPSCPGSICSATAAPAVITDPDTQSIEVGVKFRSDVAGFITALRFYKGPQNTGTHIGNLWTSAGQLLASAPFTNE